MNYINTIESKHSTDRYFPSQLFDMLEALEASGHADICSWLPHGRAFLVHKKDEFAQEVLPIWFRHSNYSSFQRQLNIYGFARILQGIDKNAYYHENFIKGDYHRTLLIGRRAIKGADAVKNLSERQKTPNFYRDTTTAAPRERTLDTTVDSSGLSVTPMTSPRSEVLEMLLRHQQKMIQPVTSRDMLWGVIPATLPDIGASTIPWSASHIVPSSGFMERSDTTAMLHSIQSSALTSAFSLSNGGFGDLESRLQWMLMQEMNPYATRSLERAWETQAILDALRRKNHSTAMTTSHLLSLSDDPRAVALQSIRRVGEDHATLGRAANPMVGDLLHYSNISINSNRKFGEL